MADSIYVGLLIPLFMRFAVITASGPEATLDMSKKIHFLSLPNFVSHLMSYVSYDQILKSSEQC